MKLPSIEAIVHDAAKEIGRCRLMCSLCFEGRDISEEQVALYMCSGWPKCCGRTMMMERLEGGTP